MQRASISAALPVLGFLLLTGCFPDVPHPVNSTVDNYCRTCHDGRAGAPASGHEDRSGCADCHGVQAWGPFPALMPHPGGDEGGCNRCHEEGIAGAKPGTHSAETDCYTCHQATDYRPWPPPMPHALATADASACVVCHEDVAHVNIDEQELASCITCHAP